MGSLNTVLVALVGICALVFILLEVQLNSRHHEISIDKQSFDRIDEIAVKQPMSLTKSWTKPSKPPHMPSEPKATSSTSEKCDPAFQQFEERLESLLPKKDFLTVEDVATVEAKILDFQIPRPVKLFLVSDYIPITLARESIEANQQVLGPDRASCRNCAIALTNRAKPPTGKYDAIVHLGMPKNRGDVPLDVPLICGAGEAAVGTGKGHFNVRSRFCDHLASFKTTDNVWTSYANMHFSPESWNVTSVADEVARILTVHKIDPTKALLVNMHSNCDGPSGRGRILAGIHEHNIIKMDSFGRCWNNRNIKDYEPPRSKWHWHDSEGNRDTTKTDIVSHYPFTASMENTIDEDYVTEKRFQALVAGSIPLVFREPIPSSEQFLPHPSAAIFVDDFDKDPIKISHRLKELAENPEKFEELQKWKQVGVSRHFVKILFHKSSFLGCRICEAMSSC